ncbi:MAG: heterodisulfide reductase-related iron-sulfur binding cluster, partial [Gemmatimonadaceae bacterium]
AADRVIFVFVLLIAAGFFSLNVQRLVDYLRIGRREDRLDHPWQRAWNVLRIAIAQKKILRDPVAGPMHAAIFWGFLVITAGTAELIIQGIAPGFSYAHFLPRPIFLLYSMSQDVFAALVLAAVVFALFRRLVLHPKRLDGDHTHHGDAYFILGLIGVLMVTLLAMFAFTGVADPAALGREKFISWGLAGMLRGVSPGTAATMAHANWWAHILLVLFFLNYLPYSKHLHIATSLFNVFFSNTSGPPHKGVMPHMDLEADVEQFGANDVQHLTWKNLLDGYSCTECGRCTAACPANITGKLLSPRKIVINTRQRLMEKVGGLPLLHEHADVAAGERHLLDDYITEEELWACTSCLACVQECPVSIDQLEIINELRRGLVLSESRFPEQLQPAFESMERNGSPWAFSPADRAQWAEGLDVPTMAEAFSRGHRPQVLYWVGCMGSFDDRAKKTTVAFARILKACGIDFAILGQEESCHGDPARRMGNEYLYQMLAKNAIETLDRYEVRTIVTACPHCFHQLGNEFPQLGGMYEVIHHSTFIERLLAENRVPLQTEDGEALTVAYHDSCYLGRYNGVYDAPRETIRRALPVVTLVEPERHRDRGFCCGAGGGRMWMEETVGKRINAERTDELLATGADTIALACPFCMTMINDSVKSRDASVNVVDIAEVVAGRLATS